MNVQAPSTTLHRPAHALLAAFVTLAVAGGTVGVVALVNNDDNSAPSSAPAISKVAPDRVLDGSPILRGTADRTPYAYRHAIAPPSLRVAGSTAGVSVLDGSPILRGHAAASAGGVSVLDGSPILRGHAAASAVTHASSVQGTQRSRGGRPLGFGYTP